MRRAAADGQAAGWADDLPTHPTELPARSVSPSTISLVLLSHVMVDLPRHPLSSSYTIPAIRLFTRRFKRDCAAGHTFAAATEPDKPEIRAVGGGFAVEVMGALQLQCVWRIHAAAVG